jgi:hypothetical protein
LAVGVPVALALIAYGGLIYVGLVGQDNTQPPAQVRVTASSGDITVALPTNVSYAVEVNAVSGTPDIAVPTNSSSHYVIHLTAHSGNINVVPARP